MSTFTGAFAYRSLPADKIDNQMTLDGLIGEFGYGRPEEIVQCAKCGESYVLIEGGDATESILQEDVEFLAKALSLTHPRHVGHLLIRDPGGNLNKHLNEIHDCASQASTLPSLSSQASRVLGKQRGSLSIGAKLGSGSV
jgi:hypothetical protein